MIQRSQPYYTQKLTYAELFRYALDAKIGGMPASSLPVVSLDEELKEGMLQLIQRKGLLNEFLVSQGLCNLCQTINRRKKVAR